MRALTRVEPLLWMLFGAGAMVAAMALPALFLAWAIAFPLGLFGTPEETFERMRFLIANPVGKGVLAVAFSLIFWHSAHHLRHFAYDMGLHAQGGLVPAVVYGLAAVGTALSFAVMAGL